jgi:hypothetical protein
VSWNEHHSLSEQLATEAESARRRGDHSSAETLYRKAAAEESAALATLSDDRRRTRGITAVSVVALWYKGHDYTAAEQAAHSYLAVRSLPEFAEVQLRDLLSAIWTTSAAEKAGITFVPGDVLVSVKGGQVIHGGAPLDLIVRKVEGIQSVLFRTVEMLMELPARKRGYPSAEIQSMFKPWLFQAPAGSYQFAVRMQEPAQHALPLWEVTRPKIENVTRTFFRVLRATAKGRVEELSAIVKSEDYRGAFLGLARNLAPAGKTFERLEVRDASTPWEPVVTLLADTRQELNATLRTLRPRKQTELGEQVSIRGVLRALHLDQDWLEVTVAETPAHHPEQHLRISEANEALDDVVGPMVNRKVLVTAVRSGARYLYRDIELEE